MSGQRERVADQFARLLRGIGSADITLPAFREAQQELLVWVIANCADIAKGLNSLGETECPTTTNGPHLSGPTKLTGHLSSEQMKEIRSAVAEYREWPFRSSDWLANRVMEIICGTEGHP